MAAEADARGADERGGPVGHPLDPSLVFVLVREDCRERERAHRVTGRERAVVLAMLRVVLEELSSSGR